MVGGETGMHCFVLMPFDDEFDAVYEHLIKKPLEEAGFVVDRADSLLNQRNILQDIVEGIAQSDLVVADLTDLNPNVFYELGLAHALGKRTVIITRDLSSLPFDLRSYRANGYSTFFTDAEDLSKALKEIAQTVVEGSAEFSNPVQDYAPTALSGRAQVASTHRERKGSAGTSRTETERDDEDEEGPGFLEALVTVENAGSDVERAAFEIARLTEGIGERFEGHTHRLERAQKNLGSKSAGALLAISRDAAKDLDGYSEDMVQPVTELRDALNQAAKSANVIAQEGVIVTKDDRESAQKLFESLTGLEEGMERVYDQVTSFAGTLAELPNMDKKLTTAARRANTIVLQAAEAIESSAAEFSRARGVVASRLDAERS